MQRRLFSLLLLMAKRLAGLVAAFFLLSFLLFAAIRSIPGDPVALRLKNPDPRMVAQERERLGLDQPWPVQFGRQITSFGNGDWGTSLSTGRRVTEDVRKYLPATIELAVCALLVGALLGTFFAFAAAWSGRPIFDRLAYAVGTTGMVVPIFWIGLLLLVVGSLWLGWFPAGGRLPAWIEAPGRTGFVLLDGLLAGRPALVGEGMRHLALPVLCLALYPAAQVCSTLRARLAEPKIPLLLASLRSRGLSPARVWLVHILKLLAAPLVTILGTTFGVLLGGAVLTETVFAWPGMGRYLVAAVLERDLYVIQNALLFTVLLVLAVVQGSDAIATWLNPALRASDEDVD